MTKSNKCALMILLAIVASCSSPSSSSDEMQLPAPELYSISTDVTSVGTTLDFVGQQVACPSGSNCYYALDFEGTFTPTEGGSEQVGFRSYHVRTLGNSGFRFGALGPNCNPFSSNCTEIGVFEGTVTPVVYDVVSGLQRSGTNPLQISLTIQPSIFVTSFTPKSYNCGQPVETTLIDTPYRLCVMTKGTNAVLYRYVVTFPGNESRFPSMQFEHKVNGKSMDCLGDQEVFKTPGKHPDVPFYPMAISLQAIDVSGQPYENAFATTVHFPMELFQDAQPYAAEFLQPKAATGCITGGQELPGVISYTISESETRSRSMTLTVSSNWSVSDSTNGSVSLSNSTTDTNSGSTGTNETIDINGASFLSSQSSGNSTTPPTYQVTRSYQTGDGNDYKVSPYAPSCRPRPGATLNSPNECSEVTKDQNNEFVLPDPSHCVCAMPEHTDKVGQQSTAQVVYVSAAPSGVPLSPSDIQNGDFALNSINVANSSSGTANNRPLTLAESQRNIPSNNPYLSGYALITSTDLQQVATSASASRNTSTVFAKSIAKGRTDTEGSSSTSGTGGGDSYSVAEQVSSSRTVSQSIVQACLPGRSCMLYNQAMKIRTSAALVTYNICGVPSMIGRMAYDDWKWNQAIAQGTGCNSLPVPDMPVACCKEPPCVSPTMCQ